ncbi:MAG: hypothetical protein B7Y25_07660 [Alphaproteobacteria bacterium 16-39-46]|nr:MAG: hypothetical protein B7Y25_07660 [Alphaproteobacteria bacterium 16-39-46]OZA41508.1 MAG: hypothetical protein B7X84_07850 [Alphaproteobacteria bacterium 17-39-52]HQS84788.1 hypothetical protein [Alphaproteobacteria bacterium]HQS94470.1 hypothetical protein [Alphaproteobacteria bacterium]
MTFKYTIPFLCGLCFLSIFQVEAVKTYQLDINLTEERKIVVKEGGETRIITKNGAPAIIISDDFKMSKTHFNLDGFSFNPSLPLKTIFHDLKKNYEENKYRTCMAYKIYVQSVQLRKFKDGKEISVRSFSQEMSQLEFSKMFFNVFG